MIFVYLVIKLFQNANRFDSRIIQIYMFLQLWGIPLDLPHIILTQKRSK